VLLGIALGTLAAEGTEADAAAGSSCRVVVGTGGVGVAADSRPVVVGIVDAAAAAAGNTHRMAPALDEAETVTVYCLC
jgi:hypothetical protein